MASDHYQPDQGIFHKVPEAKGSQGGTSQDPAQRDGKLRPDQGGQLQKG